MPNPSIGARLAMQSIKLSSIEESIIFYIKLYKLNKE